MKLSFAPALKAADSVICLPLYPALADADVARIADVVRAGSRAAGSLARGARALPLAA